MPAGLVRLLGRRSVHRAPASEWAGWLLVLAAVTAVLLALRAHLTPAHVAMAYLLVVQGGSARGGRPLGLSLAAVAFLCFDVFFLPPYGTLSIENPLNWIVLTAFLVTSIVAAQLLYRAQAEAELARERAAEVERLAVEARRAEALQEAHRAKDAVLASVSHDLRTPLTTIKALAHEIAGTGDERAEIIAEEADRLNAFVAKLLDLSRITSGAAASDIQPNEAEDLLGAAAQQCSGRLGNHELRITLDPDEPLLIGRFDFAQTLRALVNLIENAAKYAPAGTAIDIGVKRRGALLCFSVADRGPGVPESERERIFEPFYRRAGASSDVGGAGLGLSIARGVAQAQGGSLSYADRPGGGSVFTLSVPAVDVSELVEVEKDSERRTQ